MAFLCVLPLGIALLEGGLKRAVACGVAYGAAFGFCGYGFMVGWLATYDSLAPLVVLPLMAIQYALLFLTLGWIGRATRRWFWLFGSLAWAGLEYAKTLGLLAFPYGILGYSQYRSPAFLGMAAGFGVFGVTAALVAPQLWVASLLVALRDGRLGACSWDAADGGDEAARGAAFGVALSSRVRGINQSVGRPTDWRSWRSLEFSLVLLSVFLGLLFLTSLVSIPRPPAATAPKRLRIGLVQPNLPPGQSGYEAYRASLEILLAESRLLLDQGAELIVWPETAFPPAIEWHVRRREDRRAYELVAELLDFIAAAPAAFLIGNDHAEEGRGSGGSYRIDYNAALAFPVGGGSPAVYRKTRLVPFSETFPFARLLPRLALALERRVGGFWAPGPRPQALPAGGFRVATPICYEDGFGELVRAMARDGAELIIPLVNDAWSGSEAAERLHLAMSAFRAAETGLPTARCTNSGITALIDADGRIREELPPFQRASLLVDLPLPAKRATLYLHSGDWFGRLCWGVALGALASMVAALLATKRPRASRSRVGRPGRASV